MKTTSTLIAIACFTLFGSAAVKAADKPVIIAVAANFTQPAKEIAAMFEADTGNKLTLSFGSTGTLYAQIKHGAPFAVFLAADQERPKRIIEEGLAKTDSRITYVTGKLVLFSTSADRVDKGGKILSQPNAFAKIAIANPKTAPYGAAAIAALKKLGVFKTLKNKIIRGNNIAQTYQFVATGNADLGFIALSQLTKKTPGSRWVVPEALYPPIHQDAVLLKKAVGNRVAEAFLDYLKSDKVRTALIKYGYNVPN